MKNRPDTSKRQIKEGSKNVFDNPLLEKLTRSHVGVPISIFYVIAASLIYVGFTNELLLIWEIALLFIIGFLVFTLIEYVVHRHVFHMLTNTKIKEKIQYNFHGIHHEYPKDKDRLAMPPIVSLLLSVILYYLFSWVMGDYVYAFLPGVVSGYATYLLVHFAVHAYPPPRNFLKILWVNHGIHHYKNPEVAFGVSSPLWDYIFRTTPK